MMKKRILSVILVLAVMMSMAIPAMAEAPAKQKVSYEGGGCVEVEFTTRVQYKNVSVTVKNPAGKTMTVRITDLDDDEMNFCVDGLKPGTKYTFVIDGVRKGRTGSYGKVRGSFRTPADELFVKEAEYDRREGELELEFYGRIQVKNPKVVITDETGKTWSGRVTDLDGDELEIAVKGLKRGSYTVTITGIRLKGQQSYTSVTASFRVR